MAGTHGGALFDVIGNDLSRLACREEVVPADVLDAWFDPAPAVVSALRREAAWMCRTSPPAVATGLERALAQRDQVDPECVVVGAGSSDLIFRCFTLWLSPASRVFLLDPTYSEYRHVCESVVGCRVESGGSFDGLQGEYDLIVIVNPNNPTGELFGASRIEGLLGHLAPRGRVWVDEAYLPFVSVGESMKRRAALDQRLVVCQSLSKSLALSGLRVAYLVAHSDVCRSLKSVTPPWVASTPATLAVLAALSDSRYYEVRYEETRLLRRDLAHGLRTIGLPEVVEGAANWVCIEVPIPVNRFIADCSERGVLLRDGTGMFVNPPERFVRIAVRSRSENERCVAAIAGSLAAAHGATKAQERR